MHCSSRPDSVSAPSGHFRSAGDLRFFPWFEDEAELYDLEADPYEMKNLISDPKMSNVIKDLQQELKKLVIESLGLADE